ncbi:MAG: DUF5312 domain-containing protein [Treponema sp.]|jgi:hypothetical protein|nr:DUF5312 domain-containing protein [Treponema sp.]
MASGFLRRLFTFFHHEKDSGKARLLKKLGKDIKGSRFSRFYKVKPMEIEPPMGKYFYDMYKALSHAQVFLQNAVKSPQLKQITVENFLDMQHLDARQRLNADYVAERAKTMPIAEVSHLLKGDLTLLSDAFDTDFMTRVDMCYNRILSLIHLADFDYYLFLRKFDPAILERNFNGVPRFKPVRGSLLVEAIKDFLEVSYPVETELDWTIPLQILRTYKNGMDVVKANEWAAVLSSLRELRRSSILELMVQHISQDPRWEFKPRITAEHIAAAYLEERRQEVESALSGFLHSQKQNQVNALAQELFGDSGIQRFQHYTEKDNEVFIQKGLKGFTYTQSLNYLKVFLVDFFRLDMQDLCELLLIRGHWSSMEQSKEMSEIFHALLDNTNHLLALEQSLGENGEKGANIRTALFKSGRNQSQLRILNTLIQGINEEAWGLLSSTAEALIRLGSLFKEILLDVKNEGMLIMNYRELQRDRNPPLTQHIVLTYKRIYAFLQIQQLLTGVDDSLSPEP